MLPTESYKGVRDFYPEDQFVQNYIFSIWKKTAESFGYVEYSASILEPAELYRAKTGEEIVNEQTYTFIDRGGREVTLRPEMTPTVARMVAGKSKELSFPLRWYSIPNLFRYEKPQRGRLREHFQLNVDLFGSDSMQADAEIIKLAYRIMKNFGARDGDFEIRINSRKAKLNIGEIAPEQMHKITKLLDKKEKLPKNIFENQVKEILGEIRELAFEESDDVKKIISELKLPNIRFSDSLVRGFDYYTGMIFEVFDTNPENPRSLFGGGRYDDLTSLFGGEKISAVGFGAGDVTMRDFLETRGLLPAYKATADLYIATLGENFVEPANELADMLRKEINVVVDITNKKVGDQIKLADKQKIPYVLVIGENEVKTKEYNLKKLESGVEKKVKAEEIFEIIKR